MTLYEQFHEIFEFVLATDPADKHSVYGLRYEVYTREFGHAMPGNPDAGLEYDEFDNMSLHCLVRHRLTREPVACIRVIYPTGVTPDMPSFLPIEANARGQFLDREPNPAQFSRNSICEVSRAAILGRYRRRDVTESASSHDFPSTSRDYEVASLLGVAVYLSSTAMIGLIQRQHAFALMEPRLARLLGRFGLSFKKVGNNQQFNGIRAAYYIDQLQAVEKLRPELRRFYTIIRQSLHRQFESGLSRTGDTRDRTNLLVS
ncbi:PEP-CTERM/exosortase system-associated acyltransferase [Salinicola rhizosphaerae]|uniref:PEP-CTERM/exosortase system-associated acyltransferase n=1 Tax=Salinicola rhizosphaerae TaxID=1443141 RepID=UPI0016772DE6|nr:PEP-CTERM/exosortase system-associated acyltransferase [Salinicola rhizosphaerae]